MKNNKFNFKLNHIILEDIPPKKKIFFCSDLHLGIHSTSLSAQKREEKVVKWLTTIESEAYAIFFLGDIFDFWFEYKYVIPKGFIKFQAKIQELSEQKKIFFFLGNHDLWMESYFEKNLGIKIMKQMVVLTVNKKKILIGHGDDLIGSKIYQCIKKNIYNNNFCKWIFKNIHPDLGIKIALYISAKNRKKKLTINKKKDKIFHYCKYTISVLHNYHYYIFGHIHHPHTIEINQLSTYYNLGDWIEHYTYGEFDGKKMLLKKFQ